MAYLRVTASQARALTEIASISAEDFIELSGHLIGSEESSIKSSELFSRVKELSDGNESFSLALCAQTISLASFQRVEKRAADQVIEGLISGMKKSPEVEDPVVQWFEQVRETFVSLLECDAVAQPAKALYLSTDFHQLYAAGNLLTDVRPVFNQDHSEIQGAIITQTLKIKYLGSGALGEELELSLALDDDDIDKLIDEL